MDRQLPDLDLATFGSRLRELPVLRTPVPLDLPPAVVAALHLHYLELRRWNPRLSLVGPGTVHEVIARHYGESLAALRLLLPGDRRVVDLGSGAGFPGLVIAAARPDLEVVLVEARQRKWAFLRSAARRCRLSCRCLDARVGHPLPEGFPAEIDVVTSRALAIDPEVLAAFREGSPRVRFLLWAGAAVPPLPAGFVVGRQLPLPGSERRRILEISAETPPRR